MRYNTNMPAEEEKKLEDENSDQVVEEKPVKRSPEKEIYSWVAPARPFKRRNREFYITVIAMAAVVGLIMFIAEGVMPVILLASLIFLFYVLSTVEPENIKYQITDKGVKIVDKVTEWDSINRYWFSKRFDTNLVTFETSFLPGRLELVILPENVNDLRNVLNKYLPEEEAKPTRLDKATSWFAKRLPGN